MLLKIRDITTGWFAAVIVILLIIPFAFFGINYYFGQGSEPLAAKVSDTEITVNQFQRALRNFREQVKQSLGNDQVANIPDDVLKEQTMQRLINSEVIYNKTDDLNLATSDGVVLQTIASIRQFQNDSADFDSSLYELYVNTLGMSPTAFEQQIRLDIMSEQLQSALSETAFVTTEEVKDLAGLKDQRRDFKYLNLLVSSFKKEIDVSDEEINDYYNSHLDDFQHQEKVRAEYIELTVAKLAEKVELSDEEIKSFYESNTATYSEPEKRKTWQIVVRKDKDADTDKKAEELAKVDELIEVLKNAEEFDPIAEQYVNNNADEVMVDAAESGLVPRGALVAEVEDVLYEMDIDETSEAIETKDAYYIVRLKEIEAAKEKPFADVQEQVAKDLRLDIARRDYYDKAELLATTAYENPESLNAAADALEMKVSESDYFTLVEGTGLFNNFNLRQAAFSEDVLDAGNNSDVIEITAEQIIVLRVKDRIPPGPKPLDEVYEQVADTIRAETARARVVEVSESIDAALKEGLSLEQAAAEFELEVESAEDVTPNDFSVSRSVVRTAFRMPKPEAGSTTVDTNVTGNGDHAFVELSAVKVPEDIKGKQIDDVSKELVKARAGSEWDAFFEDMKSELSIETYENNL